ncbi:hypothetical protein S40285_10706 [Stachybotrys chlorohalonatus IBT 40285]|uniref:Uncharacterized protein n=1 Tax=Stachybotrys chlorohalonatus (strain IBT 40285) TaxID=1283841 RepID=A0A084QV63_STAC4|nr:hypothetical protein S40285_10706 [Stachybotrys chlorohalonata IBT 40285]
MALLWRVESHHANVKVGDCTIHMLVEITKPGMNNERKNVCNYMLIDKGTISDDVGKYDNATASMTAKMRKLYTENKVTFDVIIITP